MRLTLENELAVMPCAVGGVPSGDPSGGAASVVTTVTPLGHCASTSRNTDWSTISAPPLLRKEYTISVWNRLALFLSMCFGVEDGPLR